jgi:DNA helicase HerA-like ATPase
MGEGRILGRTIPPCDAKMATASLDRRSIDPEIVSRLVVYPSKGGLMLGIVDEVGIADEASVLRRTELAAPIGTGNMLLPYAELARIRNLLFKRPGKPSVPVRCTPDPGQPVSFAREEDLKEFLPTRGFPGYGTLGNLRMTRYPLPLDMDMLCFANTMVLGGISHGKSHIAIMLAIQLYLAGKRVLVIDPTGDWSYKIEHVKEELKTCSGLGPISATCLSWEQILGTGRPHGDVTSKEYEAVARPVEESTRKGDLTILDLSIVATAGRREEIWERCEVARRLEEDLFNEARRQYHTEHQEHGYQTCIFVEEAHQFVPADVDKGQSACLDAFSIGTKEGRKYGLGHVFIDQSLKELSRKLEVQTFIMGRFTSPGNRETAISLFDELTFEAIQRTMPGANSTWIVCGLASPLLGVPWETESFDYGRFAEVLCEEYTKSKTSQGVPATV